MLATAICYTALVVSVYDGDTIRADIQLGFNMVLSNQSIRLLYIDTPEMRGGTPETKAAAVAARDALRALILDKWVWVCPQDKDSFDSFGRVLADVKTPSIPSVSQWLLDNGYAEPYE